MLNTPLNESLHLILNYRPLGLVRATPKAFSAFGMMVETGCILLPNQVEVDVTLSYRREGRNRVHRVSAWVTRSEPGETCLEFDTETWAATRLFLDDPLSALYAHPGALGKIPRREIN
ncbi:hypothetical protein SAMN03097708_01394 [Thiohalomonas denitrificans]|uniref:PilZ domain-containing protein n=2 Tax=Thiohalomonas denitrificans TaxID=415747 RepID=A0A1G5Q6H0_9GAMM|nr:hypothetical protein SAMN03097708_01394 [Thiohalomonas denitrificans]